MSINVIGSQTTARVSVVFWVKENQDSPYQGLLTFTPEEFAALDEDDLEALQLAQFATWKENQVAARAAAEAAAHAVPAQVTVAQARRAILAAGLRDLVEDAVAAADQATQDLWYTVEAVERDNPVLLALAAAIGLPSEQLDELFRQAARL